MRVAVVGGGIAGIACAYELVATHRGNAGAPPIRCTLFGEDRRLGGKIRTIEREGFTIEAGPDSFITRTPAALELAREVGLEDSLIGATPGNRVYVLRRGSLVPLPKGMRLIVPTRPIPFLASPILSPPGKLRALLEPLVPARTENAEESIASFTRRRFGREMLDWIAEPLMAGIHLGDPEKLSMSATFSLFLSAEHSHGSVTRAMRQNGGRRTGGRRKRGGQRGDGAGGPRMRNRASSGGIAFTSLRGGMEELIRTTARALEGHLEMRLGTRVERVEALPNGGYRICSVSNHDGEGRLDADAVVLAVPASVAAHILGQSTEDSFTELRAALAEFAFVSSATVSLGFRSASQPANLDGTGFVVPRREGRAIRGCSFSSRKFDHRAPNGSFLLRAFLGEEGGYLDRTDGEIVELVRGELAEILGIRAHPVASAVFRFPDGTPQYEVGHAGRVSRLEELVPPSMYLVGSSYRGVGIPNCIADGRRAARDIRDRNG